MTDLYHESLDYLFSRLNYERLGMPRTPGELRLSRMRRLLAVLDDPQDGLRIVHVAGTKGKGSTAAMVAAALSASGVRTGLFCSPHLHAVEERFRIDGRAASPAELVSLTAAVRPAVEALDARAATSGGRGPTFFEVTTAMGLAHFAREGAGAVVLEVGLGGRLDSTNVVRPAVSAITNISFDHTRQLGTTLAAIAREKAGIIKRGAPVVSGETGAEAAAVIRTVARQRRGGHAPPPPFHELGGDFGFDYLPPEPPLDRPRAGHVRVWTWRRDWGWLRLPLLGQHQAHNAAVALATLDTLADQGLDVGGEAVARGFASLRWPVRVEVLGERPWLVVDGAHNVASARALAETLRTNFPTGPRTLVFGTTRDKDLAGQLRALLPDVDRVIATRYLENPRSVDPDEVARAVLEISGRPARVAPDPPAALELARRETPADGLICVTGSLFLAAESRAAILGLKPPPAPGRVMI